MRLNQTFTLERITREQTGSLSEAMQASLGASPSVPIPDGQIHRFDIAKRGDKVGWYVLFEDKDFSCAVFGDWRTGDRHQWKSTAELTEDQQYRLSVHMADIDKKKEKDAETAKAMAVQIYGGLTTASNAHPYLQKKRVKSSAFLMASDDRLVLPVLGQDWAPMSLQFISGDGKKQFLAGGQVSGGFCPVGLDDLEYSGRIYVAEGYATAESVHEATGKPCFVAFNAGNLPKACNILKKSYDDIVVVADNDESGTGERYAKQTELPYIMPPVTGMDANDYMVAGYDLKELLEPTPVEASSWLSSADDFVKAYSPSSWLIKHWLPAKGLAMIYGAPASGKTFVIVNMLLAISTGREDWFGFKCKKGGVVYLAGEGHEGLRKRLALYRQEMGIDSFGDFSIAKSALDLDKAEGLKETVEAIEALPFKPSVIAIDTLNRFFSGDENSAQETRGFIESCSELQRLFQCTVIIVHHTGVSADAQKRARGSSALKGAVDTEILVSLDDDKNMTLSQTKQKDIDVLPDLSLKLKGHKIEGWYDEDGEPLTSAILELPDEEDRKSKVGKEIRSIEAAYHYGGNLKDADGYPLITRDTLKTYLKEVERFSEQKVRNALRKEPYRLVGKLLDAGIIIEEDDGWSIRDMETTSALLLLE